MKKAEKKPASMEELIHRILYHDAMREGSMHIDIMGMNMETSVILVLNDGCSGVQMFVDCMLDGAVRKAADALGISNWE